jgi:DNA polymerase-1
MPFAIVCKPEDGDCFYFNLHPAHGWTLGPVELVGIQQILSARGLLVIHNAKFDMHMLENLGLSFSPSGRKVWDTVVQHRLFRNDLLSYSLDALTGTKSDGVKEWIKKNAKRAKLRDEAGDLVPCYWKVPLDVMLPYAEQDVESLRSLYLWQRQKLDEATADGFQFLAVSEVELACTPILQRVERGGLILDRDWTERGLAYERGMARTLRAQFVEMAGCEFVSSAKALGPVFDRFGLKKSHTKDGNLKTDEETLLKIEHPIGKLILGIRKAEKKADTYYANFLRMAGRDGAIHCDFRQTGADTMRMSCATPNLQNVPAGDDDDEEKEDTPFPVRGCFVPRPGFTFLSIDFAAQEMRCIIDAAEEEGLAEMVANGHDVHQATGELMGGLPRRLGKAVGFSILYGSGSALMASKIKVAIAEAQRLKNLYFDKLPKIKRFSRAVVNSAEENGSIITVYGNRLFVDPRLAYKAVNYMIQGTCAIHTKMAAVAVYNFLTHNKYRTRIVCLVHDEILFELHEYEHHIIPELRRLMAAAYPHKILPMGTSAEIYTDRWGGNSIAIK